MPCFHNLGVFPHRLPISCQGRRSNHPAEKQDHVFSKTNIGVESQVEGPHASRTPLRRTQLPSHKQIPIVRNHPTNPKGRLFWLFSHLAVVENTNARFAPFNHFKVRRAAALTTRALCNRSLELVVCGFITGASPAPRSELPGSYHSAGCF